MNNKPDFLSKFQDLQFSACKVSWFPIASYNAAADLFDIALIFKCLHDNWVAMIGDTHLHAFNGHGVWKSARTSHLQAVDKNIEPVT